MRTTNLNATFTVSPITQISWDSEFSGVTTVHPFTTSIYCLALYYLVYLPCSFSVAVDLEICLAARLFYKTVLTQFLLSLYILL